MVGRFGDGVERGQRASLDGKEDVARVKSVLFCMDEMPDDVEGGVQAMIAKMDPAEELEWWTSGLDAVQAMLPKERMKDGLVAVLFHKLCALQSVMCVAHGIPHDLALGAGDHGGTGDGCSRAEQHE